MSRRSRSHRPRKALDVEASPPLPAKTDDRGGEPRRDPVPSAPVDELAQVDAGWDELLR